MTEKLEPALTPREWAEPTSIRREENPGCANNITLRGDEIDLYEWVGDDVQSDISVTATVAPAATLALLAIANAALPDDSPYKLTRVDAVVLTDAARHIEADYRKSDDPAYLRAVAAKIAALLPPVDGSGSAP